MTIEYQPRYVAFARSNGRTPEDQHAHDRITSPNARMMNFIFFIAREVAAYRAAHPKSILGDSIVDHDHFTAFIQQRSESRPMSGVQQRIDLGGAA